MNPSTSSSSASSTPSGSSVERGPIWWTVEHTVTWETAEPFLRSDFERRKGDAERAQMKTQTPDNSVFQHGNVTPRNVDVDHAHLVPDDDWEVGEDWSELKPAYRYGVGARAQFPDSPEWNETLEARLREDWGKSYEPSLWQRVRRAVRRGFEFKHR